MWLNYGVCPVWYVLLYIVYEYMKMNISVFKWSIILWRIRRMPVCYLVWEIKLGSDAEKYYKLTTETFNSTGRL